MHKGMPDLRLSTVLIYLFSCGRLATTQWGRQVVDPFEVYAHFYDLDYGELDDDLFMIEQFAARCGSPILELACGTGRVLLPLARQGYQVTGVDVSTAMLEIARSKLASEGLEKRANLVRQDIRHLALDQRFNLAIIAINSFSHLLTTADQLAALAGIRQHLNPGGLLLLDLFNPDMSQLLDFRGQLVVDKTMHDPSNGHNLIKLRSETIDVGQQIIHVTYMVDDMDAEGHVQRTVFPFDMRYFFRGEVELLLNYAGFEIQALYGSYELDEFSGESDRIIAIAGQEG
jgi:SAM-dependent methyltransferase